MSEFNSKRVLADWFRFKQSDPKNVRVGLCDRNFDANFWSEHETQYLDLLGTR